MGRTDDLEYDISLAEQIDVGGGCMAITVHEEEHTFRDAKTFQQKTYSVERFKLTHTPTGFSMIQRMFSDPEILRDKARRFWDKLNDKQRTLFATSTDQAAIQKAVPKKALSELRR